MKSLQETYSPEDRCFGCGPANEKGLRIRSFPEGDEVVATWKAEPTAYSSCPQCKQPKLPHRVCPNCGYYAGRQAVEVE